MNQRRPIGVFDSGVGGLTVVRALRARLPGEDIVYLGDTARVPYGSKSPRTVERYSLTCLQFLLAHDVKLVLIACNTASAQALPALIAASPVPVIGAVDPGGAVVRADGGVHRVERSLARAQADVELGHMHALGVLVHLGAARAPAHVHDLRHVLEQRLRLAQHDQGAVQVLGGLRRLAVKHAHPGEDIPGVPAGFGRQLRGCGGVGVVAGAGMGRGPAVVRPAGR